MNFKVKINEKTQSTAVNRHLKAIFNEEVRNNEGFTKTSASVK